MGGMAAVLPERERADANGAERPEGRVRTQCANSLFASRAPGYDPRTLGTLPNNWRSQMILRIDRWQTELPPPADPDPDGASVVQELLGGKFGEMSTLMNYTFQSFNFRNRQGTRPFYDLIANIAAEEYGHIEVVAATINTMLTGADIEDQKDEPYKQHWVFGGKGRLPAD